MTYSHRLNQLFVMTAILSASFAQARERGASGNSYLEVAPLKGVYGQLAARAEIRLFPYVAAAAFADSLSRKGDRDDYTDKETSFGAEAIGYPWESEWGKIFVGAGLKFQQIHTGRIRTRNTRTWVRTLGDERFDRWVDQGDYWCATQTIGYRMHTASWFTASVRLVSDQILRKSLKTKNESLYNGSESLDPHSRKTSTNQFVMHVGLILP